MIRRTAVRRPVLFGTPVVVAAVLFPHPPDPTTAMDLGPDTHRYIWIHVALLFLLPLLGIVIWTLLDGLEGTAATLARVLLPVALVFYGAFDALIGIGAGVLSREAMLLPPGDLSGGQALAVRWMTIPTPLPVISTIATLTWTITLISAALAHQRAGSPKILVAGLAIAGPLFGFGHPLIFGTIGMAGLLAASIAFEFPPTTTAATDTQHSP